MRLLLIIIVVLFAAAGVVFGALNADLVSYDLVVTRFAMPKGAALLGMLLLGWILGGLLVWLFAVQPLKRKLARARRQISAHESDLGDEPHSAQA